MYPILGHTCLKLGQMSMFRFHWECCKLKSKVQVRIEKNQSGVKTNQSGEIKIPGALSPKSEEHRYVRVQPWMENQCGVKSKYPRGARPCHLTNYFHPLLLCFEALM